MHGARGQREPPGLRDERLKDSRVTMTLVQRRVGADAIEIMSSLDVPREHPFGPRDHDRQRRVVARAHPFGLSDDLFRPFHSAYFVSGPPPLRARICWPNRLSTSSTASSAVRLRSSKAGLSSMISSDLIKPESWIISMQSCASRYVGPPGTVVGTPGAIVG